MSEPTPAAPPVPDYSSLPLAQTALADPALAPADLAAIAYAQPGLRSLVARHPAAYPELLRWLIEQGHHAAVRLKSDLAKVTGVYLVAVVTFQLITPTILQVLLIFLVPSMREALIHVTSGGGSSLAEVTQQLSEAMGPWLGWMMILSALTAAAWYFLIRGRRLVTTDITTTVPVAGRWAVLGKAALLILATQAALIGVSGLISLTGYDPSKVQSSGIDPLSTTAAGIVYIVLVGPFIEELIFRGAILRRLAPYGVNFAIVTQALLFGLYHLNLYQGVFAFAVGLILGYVAVHFSLKWALLLHMLNNALATLADASAVVQWVYIGSSVLALVAVVIFAFRDRVAGRALVAEGRSTLDHPFRTGWSHPLFIVAAVLMFAVCCLMMVLL